jgi:hypothetical protein
MLKFLFLTSSNLASNPRLLKELELAVELGNKCDVIQFRLGNWSDVITENIKLNFETVNFIDLDARKNRFFKWFLLSILERALRLVNYKFLCDRLFAYSLSKRSIQIDLCLIKISKEYNWVICHNPPTFCPAKLFCQRTGSSLGVDIEDYHPGETGNIFSSVLMIRLMNAVLPFADYCSFAAPLIQKAVTDDLVLPLKSGFTVHNGFKMGEFDLPRRLSRGKLKIVWFSQNISLGRGLELFLIELQLFTQYYEIHLIGDLSTDFKMFLKNNEIENVFLHQPMPQPQLHKFLIQCDIGLAIDPPVNRNRELALTNKLFAYAQSGLYIVAIKAQGQYEFLLNSGLSHVALEYNNEEINNCFKVLSKFLKSGLFSKHEQYELGRKYCWENERGYLSKIWI